MGPILTLPTRQCKCITSRPGRIVSLLRTTGEYSEHARSIAYETIDITPNDRLPRRRRLSGRGHVQLAVTQVAIPNDTVPRDVGAGQ